MDLSTANTDTILVIEDQEISALVTTKFLENEGFNVINATDGSEAIATLIAGLKPRLILLDIMMPHMDGFEFLESFSKNRFWKDIPVVMLTALDDSEDVLKALKLGAKDYCVKPLDQDDILKTINRYI